jgi:hypothetical protein
MSPLASLSFCMASAFFQRNVNYVFGSDFHDERGTVAVAVAIEVLAHSWNHSPFHPSQKKEERKKEERKKEEKRPRPLSFFFIFIRPIEGRCSGAVAMWPGDFFLSLALAFAYASRLRCFARNS